MRRNRSLMISFFIAVVLAAGMTILLSGCASIGKGKKTGSATESQQKAGSDAESRRTTDDRSIAVEGSTGISPEAGKEPLVKAQTVSEPKRIAKSTAPKPSPATKAVAASKPAKTAPSTAPRIASRSWSAFLPKTLTNMNWNRIVPVLVGIAALSLIYGLAFWLGRLHHRRRGAVRGGGVQHTGPQAGEAVFQ